MSFGSTEEDILHWIHSFVWSGEYDEDEVPLQIEDQLGEDDLFDRDWIHTAIRREFEAKRAEEATWPEVTDFDRLDRAFSILQAQGMIALHRAGFTQSEGLDDVMDAYEDAGGKNSDYSGHCFYTEQDQENAIESEGLFIGFGHLTGNDAKALKAARMLLASLEREGFTVDWNESINSRLFVKDFRWQRRSPRSDA